MALGLPIAAFLASLRYWPCCAIRATESRRPARRAKLRGRFAIELWDQSYSNRGEGRHDASAWPRGGVQVIPMFPRDFISLGASGSVETASARVKRQP